MRAESPLKPLAIISCWATPNWLVTAINPSVIEGGFTSRVIFVVDDKRKRIIAWPSSRTTQSEEILQRGYKELVEAARRVGPIGISKGGLSKFTKWYRARATHTDPFQSSFEAREDDHVLRVAGCLSINDGVFEIQASHIGHAITIVDSAKSGAVNLFGGNFSQRARLVSAIGRVREILIEAGHDGIKHFDLQRRVTRKLDAAELQTLMKVMHESGMIQIFKVGKGTVYRATHAIERFGVASEVLASLNL